MQKFFVRGIIFIFLFSPLLIKANSLPVSIIEIGAYESTGYEYVKIYNNTDSSLNLEGWKFKEGFTDSKPEGINHSLKEYNNGGFVLAPHQAAFIVQDPDKFLSKHSFSGLILDSSWGSLKESGEKIALLDNQGNTIESFTYLACPDAPLQRINYTLADYSENNWRCSSGQDNSSQDKPASDNPSSAPSSDSSHSESADSSLTSHIIINEIYPNPPGPDNEKEFIELKNIGNTTICLNNWQLKDKEGRTFTIFNKHFQLSFIRPHDYYLVWRSQSKLALNNFREEALSLYNPQGQLIDKVAYSENAPSGKSYARSSSQQWFWTTTPTPGRENQIPPPNHPPVGVIEPLPLLLLPGQTINFDASDSYDPDGDEIFFIWDFGDGASSTLINPSHAYHKPGSYNLTLYLFDSRDASSTLSLKLKIKDASSTDKTNGQTKASSSSAVLPSVFPLLSEIYPAPSPPEEEFIELYNPSPAPLEISNWYLEDKSGRQYHFPSPTYLPALSYRAFYRSETRLALNNNQPETLTLFTPLQTPVSRVAYSRAPRGKSYAFSFSQKKWLWSNKATPEEKNIFEEVPSSQPKNIALSTSPASLTADIPFVTLEEIPYITTAEKISTQGVVVVLPGILGKRIFYINGLQIYYHQADFPSLKEGDIINVQGRFSPAPEPHLKISSPQDIQIIGHQNPPPPLPLSISQLNSSLLGQLISLQGEITETGRYYFWLDDNSGEIKISFPSSLRQEKANLDLGRHAQITGILRQNKNKELYLVPRSLSDIQNIKTTKILGKKSTSSPVSSPQSTSFLPFYKRSLYYLPFLLLLIFWALRRQKDKN